MSAERRRQHALEFLASASAAVSESLDYDETLHRIAHSAIPSFADIAVVHLADDVGRFTRQLVAAADPVRHAAITDLWQRQLGGSGPLGEVLRTGKPWIASSMTDETWTFIGNAELRKLVASLGVQSLVAAAMRTGREAFGTILFARTVSNAPFDDFEVLVAEEIARRAAGAIDRSRLYTSEHEQRERLQHLQQLSEALATALTVPDVCDAVFRELHDLVGARVVVIGVVNDATASLDILRTAGVNEQIADRYRSIPLDATLPLTEVIQTGKPIWLRTRAEAAERGDAFRDAPEESRAWAAIPLMVPGRVVGSLGLAFATEQTYPDDVRSFILSMARQAAQALERARLFDSERRAREAAEQASHAKDEFLAILSHELRTPLTTVLGWADLLRMTYSGPDDAIRFAIESLRTSALTQARLIDDLLDVSRIVTGKLHIEKRPSELTEIVRSATESVRLSAQTKGVALELDAECCIELDADPARLHQIVVNLVVNAIKFTPAGGQISVSVQRREAEADIVVEDTGIGISSDFLPHVFERFRQASMGDSRTYSGLGLGLSIVQRLVRLHDGRVRAESRGAGKGATFTVTLPVRELQRG